MSSSSGGAMPYAFSFCFPAEVIQSVVQAGLSTNSTLQGIPLDNKWVVMSVAIVFIAGHPL
jgi:hypothetical protein